MKRDDIEKELLLFRNIWTWVDEEARAWLCHIRQPVNLVRRDYKILKGVLGSPHFDIKSVDVDVEEEITNYHKGTLTIEVKTVTIPINQLVDYEFIHAEEVMPMPKEPWQEAQEKEVQQLEKLVEGG